VRSFPHPEERRRSLSTGRVSRGPVGRFSKDESASGLMVRDGARAPPHHEEIRIYFADFAGDCHLLPSAI
jgi:hypothetical protein